MRGILIWLVLLLAVSPATAQDPPKVHLLLPDGGLASLAELARGWTDQTTTLGDMPADVAPHRPAQRHDGEHAHDDVLLEQFEHQPRGPTPNSSYRR